MWRLNSYWRYKQIDDGVLVEIESLTLSRQPAGDHRPADPADRQQHRAGVDDADAGVGPARRLLHDLAGPQDPSYDT